MSDWVVHYPARAKLKIMKALLATHGDIDAAAKKLLISSRILRIFMPKLGITLEEAAEMRLAHKRRFRLPKIEVE